MSLLSDLTQGIENKILSLLSPILGPLKGIISIATKFRDNTTGILDAATSLIKEVEDEYSAIKNFKERPEWKNRVISVPHVINSVTELAKLPSIVIAAFKDLITQVRSKLQPAAVELEDVEGLEDLRALGLKLGSRIATIFEKVLGWVTLVLDALVTIRSAIDDLKTIVDAIRTVREDLENLDGLFLTQKNPRKSEQLLDGGTIKIRVGSLHPK